MHTLYVSKSIDVPFEEAWALLDDFGQAAAYSPGIEHSVIVNGIPRGKGARRACTLERGGTVQEEIIAYQSRQGFTIEMVEFGPVPLKKNRVQVSVEAVDAQHTRISLHMKFLPRFGILGWLLAKLVLKGQLEKTLYGVIDGIRACVKARAPAQEVVASRAVA